MALVICSGDANGRMAGSLPPEKLLDTALDMANMASMPVQH